MKITVLQDITPIITSFNCLGINIDLQINRTFANLERLMFLMIGVVMWAPALFRNTVTHVRNIDELLPSSTIDVQVLLTFTKLVILLVKRKRFLRLNANLEQLALTGNQQERELWNANNRTILPICKAYYVTTRATITLCVLLPIFKLIYNYLLYNEFIFTLPLPGLFPYDYTQPLYFILTLLLTVLFGLFFVFTMCSVDCIFGWFVYNISAHFQIMRYKLEQLLQLDVDAEQFQLDFAALVEYHNQIIALSEELNGLYSPIIFMAVTCSCLPLCFLIYQLSYLSDPVIVPFIMCFLSSISMQLAIYCFGGGKVQGDCHELCTAIYLLVPWERLPPKQSRMCLMPLIRSQRDLLLTGYFFTANRTLIVWIFKTTGSFIAMLFALRKKEK